MLQGGDDAFNEYVRAWRERATRAAQDAFELVKEAEKRAFGLRSYFYHLERAQEGIPFPVIHEDPEVVDIAAYEYDPTVRFRFAEEGEESDEGRGSE